MRTLTIAALVSAFLFQPLASAAVSEKEAHEIGLEAYVYLYPLVTMDVTRRVMTNVPPGAKPGSGPANTFSHIRTYPTADFRDVVRPNFDTLYSTGWLDLRNGPMIVTVPDTGGRYYLLPMIDMWTDVFAVPGARTSGTSAAAYALVFRGSNVNLPAGVERIDAPTPFVWIIGRTQTNGPSDYEAVHKVQDGFTMTPLSQWGKRSATPPQVVVDPSVDMKTPPLNQVNSMPADKFFSYAAELLKVNPPHATDWSIVARMRRIGLEPGKPFDLATAAPAVRSALQGVPQAALKEMKAFTPKMARVVNGWQMNTETMGVYGNYYLKRAIVAAVGLGANQALDAVYPLNVADADGQPLEGTNRYVMHFEKKSLPPAKAFWSITMYDEEGFQVANPINRFAIGDRDKLRFNDDGSLDIYIQHESPGAEKESNWLPSPATGPLGLTMRVYAPETKVLMGAWAPPAIEKVD